MILNIALVVPIPDMSIEERERLVVQIKRLDAEIPQCTARAEKLERAGFAALTIAGIVAAYSGYCLYLAFTPQGDDQSFLYCLLGVVSLLGVAYRLIFNPSLNRKILALQEERFALRRRLELS